jgi:hypothetical protein
MQRWEDFSYEMRSTYLIFSLTREKIGDVVRNREQEIHVTMHGT